MGSAQGISQVLEEVAKQIGRPWKDYSDKLQVVEGDVGTCVNFEALQNKRMPAGNQHEGLHNFLTVPGAAHTMWNFAHSLLLSTWGDPKDCKRYWAVVFLGSSWWKV